MQQELLDENEPLKTCRCGYHKHDPHVVPQCRYNWFGWVRLVMGVTAYPEEVYYQCEKCEQIIDRTTDLEIRRLQV